MDLEEMDKCRSHEELVMLRASDRRIMRDMKIILEIIAATPKDVSRSELEEVVIKAQKTLGNLQCF